MKSRTQQALELVAEGLPPIRAAQLVGISSVTVYKALKRARIAAERPVCPHCGQVIRKR